MIPGKKIKVTLPQFPAIHPGIRFDKSQVACSANAPKGTSGEVLRVSGDLPECLVERYWNHNAVSAPGSGEMWKIWVKREWFGQLFD
jgi:hypothetical protein